METKFQVFDSLLHPTGKPADLWTIGLRPIPWLSFGVLTMPDDARVKELALAMEPGTVTMWDLELWDTAEWDYGLDHMVVNEENLAKQVNAMRIVRANQVADTQFGTFGEFPRKYLNVSTYDYDHHRRAAYRELHVDLAILPSLVDILFPEMYPAIGPHYDAGIDRWKADATIQMNQMSECSNTTYAYLMPSLNWLVSPAIYVSGDYWRAQLEWCWDHPQIDGVVLFRVPELAPNLWDGTAAWWLATLAFLATHGLNVPAPKYQFRIDRPSRSSVARIGESSLITKVGE